MVTFWADKLCLRDSKPFKTLPIKFFLKCPKAQGKYHRFYSQVVYVLLNRYRLRLA